MEAGINLGNIDRINNDQKVAAAAMVILDKICKAIDCPLQKEISGAAHRLGLGVEFDYFSKDMDFIGDEDLKRKWKERENKPTGIDAFKKAIKDAERKQQNPDQN